MNIIKNPTVFLKDGELYCLTVEVPERPVKSFDAAHYVSAFQEYEYAITEYDQAIASAKSSAVKVKNRDEILIHRTAVALKQDYGNDYLIHLRARTTDNFKLDTLYTLTGYEAEVMEEIDPYTDPYGSWTIKLATITPINSKKEVKPDLETIYKIESIIRSYKSIDDHDEMACDIFNSIVEPTRAENKELLSKIKEIEKLSRYDKNHDNILYRLKEIHELVQSLITKYEKK